MDSDISRIIAKTLKKEGVYSNDQDDAGGETKYGISRKAYPDVDIKNLTRDEAILIYERDYYRPLEFDGTERIDYRWKLFDIGVNCGVNVAKKFRKAVASLLPDFDTALEQLGQMQAQRYRDLATRYPVFQKFLHGWLRRAADLGENLL